MTDLLFQDGDRAARRLSAPYVTLHSGLALGWDGFRPQTVRNDGWRLANLAGKRLFDIIAATTALIALLPLLLALALAIRFSGPGPVIFSQWRIGRHGRPFRILKFRTMHFDLCDACGREQTVRGDHRVTALGRALRRTSADELPQLWNVLVGEMSLVGPRPHVESQLAGGVPYAMQVSYYALRHDMAPGITGWSQVNGLRGPTVDPHASRCRIEHDLAYIHNFSLWLDIRIICITLGRELLRRDAF